MTNNTDELLSKAHLNFLLNDDLLERFKIMACDHRRSGNSEIVDLIIKALDTPDKYKHMDEPTPINQVPFTIRVERYLWSDFKAMAKSHNNSANTELVQVVQIAIEEYEEELKTNK